MVYREHRQKEIAVRKELSKGQSMFCPGALWTQAGFMQVDSMGGGINKSSKGSFLSSLG